MTKKYFSATQLVISRHAALYYAGIPKQTSSRYAEFQIYETWNVLLKGLVLDSLAKKLTDLCANTLGEKKKERKVNMHHENF